MPTDPFAEAFADVGDDFETYFAGVLADVTVASIDPDSGEASATAAAVPALKRSRRRFPFRPGDGELGGDQCRFVFKAGRCAFALKARDRVTDAAGLVWLVDERGAELIAFGQLWVVNVTAARG